MKFVPDTMDIPITSTIRNLFSKNKDVNILLLGATGVGKTTVINSLASSLTQGGFKDALKTKPSILTRLRITLQGKTVLVGEDKNEESKIGASATQNVRTYTFPLKNYGVNLNIIDTPGLADTRGVDRDTINCENILESISNLENLHAICIVVKAGVDRISLEFEYCLRKILEHLDKSAAQNIIFIITRSESREFKGAETLLCLKKFADNISEALPEIAIPVGDKNTFQVDNEGFKYLVALKEGKIREDKGKEGKYGQCWDKSYENYLRMLKYVIGDPRSRPSIPPLEPHQVQATVSINEARRMVIHLQQPLTEIMKLISEEVDGLKKHKENLTQESCSLEELKAKLYIPYMGLKVIEISEPMTVCASIKCIKIENIEGKENCTYPQVCHSPCALKHVKKEIVGDPSLKHCFAIDANNNCRFCSCNYKDHMHIYYKIEAFDGKLEDKRVLKSILTHEAAMQQAQVTREEMDKRKKELEDEQEIIIKTTASFIHFIQHNSMTKFSDSVEAYINHLIEREKKRGSEQNTQSIENLETLLKKHLEEKAAYDQAVQEFERKGGKNTNAPSIVNSKTISESIKKLFQMKRYGSTIKHIYEAQKTCIENESKNNPSNYVHPEEVERELEQIQETDQSEMEVQQNDQSEAEYFLIF